MSGPADRPPRRQALAWLAAALLAGAAQAGPPEVVAAAKPAVMAVGIQDPLASPRFNFRGTGFVVGNGRLLVTNAHVLPDEPGALRRLALRLPGNRGTEQDGPNETRALTLLALDRIHDLALLEFSGDPLPALTLAEAPAREGQAALFIGFPIGGLLGFSPVSHRAMISSITPIALPPPTASRLDAATVSRLRQGPFDIYQLDGTAYPGNSGGPLLDAESGEVLGVLNMVLVKGSRESLLSQPSGISYAIPISHLRALLQRR
jgi:S1-C subfamily serine protease